MRRLMWLLIAVVLCSGVCYGADVQLGGLIQVEYADPRGKDASFAPKSARLKASVAIAEKIKGVIQIDAAKEPEILDLYLDYSHSKLVNLRVGQFSLPFGYETQASKYDLEAVNRSQVIGMLWYNGVSKPYVRDLGLTLSGRLKLLEYKVGVVNGNGYNYATAPWFDTEKVFPTWGKDNNNTKDIVGRVGVGIPMFFGLGFSFYQGKWPVTFPVECNDDRTAKALDVYLDTGKVIFQYEHVWAEGRLKEPFVWKPVEYGGYYILVGYRIIPLIEPVYKIDACDPDEGTNGDRLTDMYGGVNLNVHTNARVQMFYTEHQVAHKFDTNGFMAMFSARF